MNKHLAATLGIVALAATPVAAQDACPMNYEFFEYAVPHLDLETCPADLKREDAFCRASVGNDKVHVYVFRESGSQCLVATKSYGPDDFKLSLK